MYPDLRVIDEFLVCSCVKETINLPAMCNGSLVVVGGCDRSGDALDSVEIYDVRAGKWRAGRVLSETLECATSSEVDDMLYVTGTSESYATRTLHPNSTNVGNICT